MLGALRDVDWDRPAARGVAVAAATAGTTAAAGAVAEAGVGAAMVTGAEEAAADFSVSAETGATTSCSDLAVATSPTGGRPLVLAPTRAVCNLFIAARCWDRMWAPSGVRPLLRERRPVLGTRGPVELVTGAMLPEMTSGCLQSVPSGSR